MAALTLALVLATMEMTVTSTAMPTIIGQLHGLEHYSWVASIYLLASTITMPFYGRLADAFGRKRVILWAIVLFSIGSLLSASAGSMIQLIVFRGIQGLGAGGISPLVLTIIGDIYTIEERASIQSVFSALWGTSALAGPALGAFLVATMGWRSVFFVNLPFGALAIVFLLWKYHETEKPRHKSLDLVGFVSLSASCMTLLLLVSRSGPDGWSLLDSLGLLALMATFLTFFIWHELQTQHPLMPPRLLMSRAIGPAIVGNFLLGGAYIGIDTYVPLYVQGGRGGGAGAAAGVLTPIILTWALNSMVAARMMVRVGFRTTALMGTIFLIGGFGGLVLCAVFSLNHWFMTATLAFAGMGMGPCSIAYLLGAQEAVDWEQRGSVTSSVTFCRTIGGALSVGVLGAIFNILMAGDLTRLKARGVAPAKALDPALHNQIPHDALLILQHAISTSLTWVFAVMLLFTVLQAVVTMFMPRQKCQHHVGAAEAMESVG